MTASLGGHERVYRSLLRIYPADYRHRFGDQMVQLFGDQMRADGGTRTWLRAVTDLPAAAMSEHLRRNRPMAHSMSAAPTPIARLLGLLGVAGGAVILIAFLGISLSPDLFNLRLVLFNIGAIAVAIGVHQRQASSGRLLSLSAVIPVVASNALYLFLIVRAVTQQGQLGPGDYQPVWLWMVGGAAMWLSDAWFGVVAFRLNSVSRVSALALVVGSILAFLGMSNFGLQQPGSLTETIIMAGIAIHGLAWILLGLDVAFRRRPAEPAAG